MISHQRKLGRHVGKAIEKRTKCWLCGDLGIGYETSDGRSTTNVRVYLLQLCIIVGKIAYLIFFYLYLPD